MEFVGCTMAIHSSAEKDSLKQRVQNDSVLQNGIFLDTCQRFEYYGILDGVEAVKALPYRQVWSDLSAFTHLVKVGCGLESRVVGELEILGQIRSSYRSLAHNNARTALLDKIIQKTLRVIRAIRRKSGIDKNIVSLPTIVANIAEKYLNGSEGVIILGNGFLAKKIISRCGAKNAKLVKVFSRSISERSGQIGNTQIEYYSLSELSQWLKQSKIVIAATSSPSPILTASHFSEMTDETMVIDLGEKANCSPSIRLCSHLRYIGLSEIEALVNQGHQYRNEGKTKALELVKYYSQIHSPLFRKYKNVIDPTLLREKYELVC